jgi:hypothetical protein
MNSYLWGNGFRGVIESFGRPGVQHWTGVAFERAPSRAALPRASSRQIDVIPPGTDPATKVDEALNELRQRTTTLEVHSTAVAIDSRNWELVHLTQWEHTAPDRYQVLHLSTPQLGDMEAGRHW